MIAESSLFAKTLKEHGFSMTRVRRAVFEHLSEQSASTMQQLVTHLPFDRASIYRTISLFENIGITHRVYAGWKYKVELSDTFDSHHHHATCLRCSAVISLDEDKDLEKKLANLAKKYQFKLASHQVELSGYCYACSPETTSRT